MPEDPTKREHHVTELAGPDDRWVSVTDASRIARRQEHTIRTWIAQGLLPVNPVRVGINKKTRQVRLSDLVTLTPIIDPDAGIATDLGTLDLPSIPKQQQQLMGQMAALKLEMTGELASLGGHLRDLAGKHEQFAEETQETWQVHQQQYQQLAHRDEEQQQHIQQVRDSLTERLDDLDRSLHQELADQQEQHQRLLEQVTSYSRELQQAREDLSTLVVETEQALRQALSDQVGHSEATLRQALEAVRAVSAEATEQVRQNVVGLEERLAHAVEAHEELMATMSRWQAHTDQQFSQVSSRLEPLETMPGMLQDEIQKHEDRVGQLATQVAGLESTWQERAQASEQEALQLRRDLAAQERFQQALQQQLAEERKAREELARQVSQRLAPGQQKGKGHE
jgi:DNA repair exonuclease SbcCD ATPase subunit